ncbi:TPA: helix-turn-helix transcriptional regulator [Photobacterium damselae]
MFNHLLLQYRKENQLTQNDLAEILAMEHPELNKLDSVTISRWETKKTVPSLKRQFIILEYINKLSIENIDPINKNVTNLIEEFTNNKFSNSLSMLSEIAVGDAPLLVYRNNDQEKTPEIFYEFIQSNKVETIILKKEDNIEAFLKVIKKHKSIDIFALAKTKESFEKMFVELYDLVFSINTNIINIYSFDRENYKLLTSLDFKKVKTGKLSRNLINFTLFQKKRIDFLSNRDILDYYRKYS